MYWFIISVTGLLISFSIVFSNLGEMPFDVMETVELHGPPSGVAVSRDVSPSNFTQSYPS